MLRFMSKLNNGGIKKSDLFYDRLASLYSFFLQSSDVFSFGVILCEILTRLDADPDILTRTRDFGVDRDNLVTLIDHTEVRSIL